MAIIWLAVRLIELKAQNWATDTGVLEQHVTLFALTGRQLWQVVSSRGDSHGQSPELLGE